jgi:GT2 family glycosyltransferase
VGLLDERFESYLEDVEFGVRCALAGFTGVYVPEARASHKGNASLGRWNFQTVRRISRNQVWLLAAHYPTPLLRRFWRPILAAHVLWGAVALRHGAGLAWLAGKWDGLRNWSTIRVGHKPQPEDAIASHLLASVSLIREIQDKTFFDSYWRMYFLLTRTGAK